MPARKINFPILILCLLVVATLVFGLITSTRRYNSEALSVSTEHLRTTSLDVQEAPPPPVRNEPAFDVPPPPPAMPRTRLVGSGPDVAPTAAPGVSFNYRYAYRLPIEKIAGVQEQHARACEQLGVSRCRITGLRYREIDGGAIEAMLALKLDPGIARRFGQIATQSAVRADGRLIESDITGTDVAAALLNSSRDIGQLSDELRRVERRLADRGLSPEARNSLELEAQQLRQSIRAAESTQAERRESLASTPLAIEYVSGPTAIAQAPLSLRGATARAFATFATGMSMVLIVLVTLLPWTLLGLALWWIGRSAGRRLRPRDVAASAST